MASAEKVRLTHFPKHRLLLAVCICVLSIFSCNKVSAQSYTATTCSGVAFTFNEPGFDPAETYDWTFPVPSPGGSLSGASSQTAQSAVSQTLTNNTNAPATATYTVSTSLGTSFTLVVTVNPKPAVAPQVATICSGAAFNITPINVPSGTTYTWALAPVVVPAGNITPNTAQNSPQISISQALTNPSTASATAQYAVTPSANGCNGNPFNVTVTVNPIPALNNNPSPVTMCSGTTFGYAPTSLTAGANIAWSRAVFTGISNAANSGANNPNEILNNTTTAAVTVNYVFIASANGCSNSNNPNIVSVVVNPKPVLSSPTNPTAICSGNFFNYTPAAALSPNPTSFSWTRSVNASINGGTTNVASTIIPVNEQLNNSTTQSTFVTYSFTITDGVGCVSVPQFVFVGVNPAPVVSDMTLNSCTGNKFFASPAGVPVGTLYSWVTPTSVTVTGGTADNNQPFIGQTLTNTGTIDYLVTPNNFGCIGGNFHVVVTVIGGGAASLINNGTGLNTCSGILFNNYTPTAPNGVSYAWTRFYTSGISPSTNTGGPNINETLTNSSTVPLTASYGFRTTDGTGCTNTQVIQVTVNPTASLTSVLNPTAICSSTTFNYTPFANVFGTTFTWTRGIFGTNQPTNGTDNPGEILFNANTSALTVNYVYTLHTTSGCSSTQTVTVLVSPTPKLSSSPTPPAICSGTTFSYSPSSLTGSPVFTWSRAVVASISKDAGTGSGNIAEPLVNTGITAVSVRYLISTTANGCGNTEPVDVFVNPAPNIANLSGTTCSNTSLTTTPTGVPAGTVYTWGTPVFSPLGSISNSSTGTSQANITQQLINGTTSQALATYTVTPVANGCTGSVFNVFITVNPVTTLSSTVTPLGICSNSTFSYVPTSSTTGSSFSWTRNSMPGISNSVATGTGNPNEILVNTTSNAITVPYTYAISSPDGCINSQTVNISVKPLPVFSSAGTATVCSGIIFNYTPNSSTGGTTYTWSRQVLPTISNGAGAGAGTGNPAEILVNTSTTAVIVPYAYVLTAGGCSNPQTVNLTVNATPIVPDQVTSTCNSTAFNVNPSNVPTGTVYTWTVPTYSPAFSINGGSAQPIAQSTISQTLNNSTASPANATYTVTPVANSCTGNSFLITVTVNTATVLSTSLAPPAVCSNAVFNYNPASNTPGASFAWTRAVVPGISNNAAAGSNNPAETLINITPNPVTVSYTYNLNTPNSCLNSQTISVVVNPSPILTSTLTPPAICSGTVFNYTPTTATAGVAYTWNRPVVQSISNGAGAGSGPVNPSELLVNTSINPVTVAYNYTLTANSCTNAQTVNVIVNPIPSIINQTTTICGNTSFNILPTNIPAATQYTWTVPTINPAGSIGGTSAQATAQTILGQLLTNQTLNSATATYTVTPVASGCTGASFSVAVTVKPTPVIADKLLNAVCGGTAFSYTPTNVPAATTYTWDAPVLGPANGLTGGSAQTLNQPLISQTLSSSNNLMDTASYIVTPATAGCAGTNFTLIVPVKPIPVFSDLKDTICTGSTFSVIPPAAILNTTYTWTAPTSVPVGSVTGGSAQSVGGPVISQTLFNTSIAIAQMVYTVTPSAGGCAGPAFRLNETVGIPLAPVANKTAIICSGTAFDVTPTTTPPNTTYTWGVPVVTAAGSITGSGAAPTRQIIVGQTLTNITSVINKVVYTVVPFNTGCSGSSFTATISVRPVPKATVTGKPVICRYPVDTVSVSFVGQAPWSFDYTENGVAKTQTGITASPYTFILPALAFGVPSRILDITRVNDFACVDSVDTSHFVQRINPLPIGKINSIHGAYICNNIYDSLFVSYSSFDTLRFQWSRDGINLPGATTDSISTLLGGRYNTMLTNQYGCIDSAISSVY
jgi:hypothetical protein